MSDTNGQSAILCGIVIGASTKANGISLLLTTEAGI